MEDPIFLFQHMKEVYEKMPPEQKDVVRRLYVHAHEQSAIAIIGAMTGLALQKPTATWWEVAKEALDSFDRIMDVRQSGGTA